MSRVDWVAKVPCPQPAKQWYGKVVEKASHTGRGRRVELRCRYGSDYDSTSHLILVVKPQPGWDSSPTSSSFNRRMALQADCKLSANGPIYFSDDFLRELEQVIGEARRRLEGETSVELDLDV